MIVPEFLTGGKAIFTVNNDKGEHFTYRIKSKADKKIYFASLLTGPNNTSDYTYMGLFLPDSFSLRITRGSRYSYDTKSIKVFIWACKMVGEEKTLPEGYDINHIGFCCRCRKPLTEPESINIGMGPHCRKQIFG